MFLGGKTIVRKRTVIVRFYRSGEYLKDNAGRNSRREDKRKSDDFNDTKRGGR
jgi:hypothetical protein